jgi:thiol-disulfide isomerase/thioredoxin
LKTPYFLLFGFLATAFGVAGFLMTSDHFPKPSIHEDVMMISVEDRQPLDWEFLDLKGVSSPLSGWTNDIVVLNFWGTWCPPCLREIPLLVTLQEKYRNQGIQFIGIALDSEVAVREFKETTVVNYPLLLGDTDVVRFMEVLGNEIGALPFTVVLSREGEILYSHQGEWELAEAENELLKALKVLQISR